MRSDQGELLGSCTLGFAPKAESDPDHQAAGTAVVMVLDSKGKIASAIPRPGGHTAVKGSWLITRGSGSALR